MVNSNEKAKFFEIFKKWTDTMTMHGFPNIFRTGNNTIRIMWIFVFILSNGFCFWIITRILINFFKYDVVTTIKVVEKDFLPFPAVTVCNLNPFINEEGSQYVSKVLNDSNLTDFPQSHHEAIFFGKKDDDSLIPFNYMFTRYLTTTFSKTISMEQRKNLITPYEQMFISCLYNMQPCRKNDWVLFYDTVYGTCYRFNSGLNSQGEKTSLKNSFQSGKYSGLMIELFVGISEDQKTLSTGVGAHVFINDNLFLPKVGEGFDVSPGTSSNLVVERFKTEQLSQPYSECIENSDSIDSFDSEYYRKVFRSNLTYSQTDCFYAYMQSETYKRCNCDEIGHNIVSENDNICDNITEQICSMKTVLELLNNNYKEKLKSSCPLNCHSVSLAITKSENKYPSVSYGNDLINFHRKIKTLFGNRSNISNEELRENMLAVNVYYENIRQTEIGQNPSVTWDGLVGSIGGTLGLFLGISFLSFAEIFDFFFQIIFHKIKINKSKVLAFKN